MDYYAENMWDEDEIKVNVLGNENIMNEGKMYFVELFNQYKDRCSNTKFEALFDFHTWSVIKVFVLLKKQMIRCILVHMNENYDNINNEMILKKLNKFKKQMFYFID